MAGPLLSQMPLPKTSRFRFKEISIGLLAVVCILWFLLYFRDTTEGQATLSSQLSSTNASSQIDTSNNDGFYWSDTLAQQHENNAGRPQAIIIETDIIPNLVPLILHFATILGPGWGIILYTLEHHYSEPHSLAFQRFLRNGRIEVRFLPAGTQLYDSGSVSRFLTQTWLWEQVEHAERILLFQSDSVLCSKSEVAVEDFFEYDLIGAPIAPQYGQGYNGGLSIRNPRLFLNITREVEFSTSGHEFEDQFFYAEAKAREDAGEGVRLPSADIARLFSVETMYYETPLGYHQPQRWQPANMAQIEDWCPEVKMLVGRRAQ